jgi:predicted restriction endonuclease
MAKMKLRMSFEEAQKKVKDAKIPMGQYDLIFEDRDRSGECEIMPWAVFRLYLNGRLTMKNQKKIQSLFDAIFFISWNEFDYAAQLTGVLSKALGEKEFSAKLKGNRRGPNAKHTSQDNLNKILLYLHQPTDEGVVDSYEEREEDNQEIIEIRETEKRLAASGINHAEIEAWRKQRLGQGRFRDKVIERCGKKCIVTGVDRVEILIASHIQGWAECTNDDERLDGANGLLLAPHIDKLFDKHLMSFENDGAIKADVDIRKILRTWGVAVEEFRCNFSEETKKYMDFHRAKYKKINRDA